MEIRNFDQFFRDNPIPMWVYDPEDYSIQKVNQAMADTYGYSREEMLSFTLFDLRPREEVPKIKKYLSQADNQSVGDEGVWKHQKKNGEYVYARVVRNPVTFDNEEHDFQLVMYKDLTSEMNTRLSNDMFFKHSLDGIMLTNPNGEILQANQAACDILGMSEQEITAQGRGGIVARDEKLQKALSQRSQLGTFAGELTFIHKSGRKIPVELTSSVFVNYAGEKRTSLIFRDISDRKAQQQALREEKEFTEAVMSSLPGVFYVLDHQGHVVRFNDHAMEVFGLSADQFIGRSAAEFVHESDREKVPEEIRAVLEEGYRVFELTLKTGDGTPAIYRFNAERLQQSGQTYIIGTGVDVTKKKQLEEQLSSLLQEEHAQRKKAEADRDKLKEMFEEAPSPKCLLEGPELRYVIANKAYRQVVGQEDIVGRPVIDVLPEVEEQGYIDLLEKVYQTGEPYLGFGDPVQIDKDNEGSKQKYIFNLLFAPLFDEEGEVYGIFIEALDFSEQITYQQQLRESLTEKETLLAEIHHRVKNNLAIVTSMMQLQAMETEDIDLQGALRSAQQRIQTIATIHELLYSSESLSHLNFGEHVKQLLHNLEEIYNTGKQITIVSDVEQVPMNINQAIPCALMVNEVVTNAYKHAFNLQKRGEIGIQLYEENGNVVVEITDNGVGFPSNIMQEGASTIGMTLINLLKQQLEGDVYFSNKNGTQFKLVFEKADVKGSGSSLIKN
ncbi:PAS domain S-box-containing protein [Fodinibius roseus]|uniref:histidine kinase n=1 Tax=Fodinibius roseus TaxID=1194090 RepID=A0A1M5J142_9BACT|nr:PAS domain S-box protein [Fodinibius roseus]SHG33723.1 PAS domain S-box-containing protein [Fodinibius roseus]